jgi:hypothetical protein
LSLIGRVLIEIEAGQVITQPLEDLCPLSLGQVEDLAYEVLDRRA